MIFRSAKSLLFITGNQPGVFNCLALNALNKLSFHWVNKKKNNIVKIDKEPIKL